MDALEALPSLDLKDASFSSIGSMLSRGMSEEFHPKEASRFFAEHLSWLGTEATEQGANEPTVKDAAAAPRTDMGKKDSLPWQFMASLSPFTEPWDWGLSPVASPKAREDLMVFSPAASASHMQRIASPTGIAQRMQTSSSTRMMQASFPALPEDEPEHAPLATHPTDESHASVPPTEAPQVDPPQQPLDPQLPGILTTMPVSEAASPDNSHTITTSLVPSSTALPWGQPTPDSSFPSPPNHAPSPGIPHPSLSIKPEQAADELLGYDQPPPPALFSSIGHRAVITSHQHHPTPSASINRLSHTSSAVLSSAPAPSLHSAILLRPASPALGAADPSQPTCQHRVNPFLQVSIQYKSSGSSASLMMMQTPGSGAAAAAAAYSRNLSHERWQASLPSPMQTPSTVTSSQASLGDHNPHSHWGHFERGSYAGSLQSCAGAEDSFGRRSTSSAVSLERRVSRVGSGVSRQNSVQGKHVQPSASSKQLQGASSGGVNKEGHHGHGHAQRRTKKDEIARLEAELHDKLRLATELEEQNAELQRKERLLNMMMRTGGRSGAVPLFGPRDGGGMAPHLLSLIQTFRSSVTRMMCPQLAAQVQQQGGSESFGVRDFCKAWQVVVAEVSEVLQDFDSKGLVPEVTQRMEEVCDRAQSWTASVCIYKPSAMLNVGGMNLVTGEMQAQGAEFWQGIVARLELSEDQQVDLYHVYQIYAGALTSIRSQEVELMSELTAVVDRDVRIKGAARHAPVQSGLYHDNNVELQDVMDRVQGAVRQSHMLHFMACFLFNALLTPLQRCLVIFHSMPSFPRYKMLLQAVASSLGDSPAQGQMDD